MQTFIYSSNSLELRQNTIQKQLESVMVKKEHPDVLYFPDGEKLGVDSVKKVKQFLSIKALGKVKIVVLESADDLTIDAQNSFLKTLEEPGEASMIILGVFKLDNIISTVQSRAQIVYLNGDSKKQNYASSQKFVHLSTGEKMTFIEKLGNKEEFFDELICFLQAKFVSSPIKNIRLAQLVLDAQRYKNTNGNLRAILENLALGLENYAF